MDTEGARARISANGEFLMIMVSEDFRKGIFKAEERNRFNMAILITDGLAFGFHAKDKPMALAEFRPILQRKLSETTVILKKQQRKELLKEILI